MQPASLVTPRPTQYTNAVLRDQRRCALPRGEGQRVHHGICAGFAIGSSMAKGLMCPVVDVDVRRIEVVVTGF